VGHRPLGVHGVAEEAAAEVVPQPPLRHLRQGEPQEGLRLVAPLPPGQQQQGVELRLHGEPVLLAEATGDLVRQLQGSAEETVAQPGAAEHHRGRRAPLARLH